MVEYKILVSFGNQTLVFLTNDYQITEKVQIRFIDNKTNIVRIFDSRVCEIQEVFKND